MLLAQGNRIERLILRQPSHNRELRPQHVALGYIGDDFLRRRFDFFERLRQIHGGGVIAGGDRQRQRTAAASLCCSTIFWARSTADSMA